MRNADVPEDRRIEFRMGINLGDVIVEGDDIFGDGVNVAARLEGVARPGGIAVSAVGPRPCRQQARPRFSEDKGDQQLKNIAQPVRVYDVVLEPRLRPKRAGRGRCFGRADKPSIAVLPFTNMSGDPEQEFFSDGITEDIITDLSKICGLFVVGRNTSFTYKGKSVQLPQVASELGVKFLLEGSVRKAGQRVRVTGQLIDGPTGGHVWADRYDRDLTDIFAIQDEITKTIVDQLKVRLLPEEKEAIGQAPTENVEAYTYYLKGRQFFHNSTKVVPRPGPADVRQGDRARSDLCARLCRHCQLRRAAGRLVRRADPDGGNTRQRRQGAGARSRAGRGACGARRCAQRTGSAARRPRRRSSKRSSSIPTASRPIRSTPATACERRPRALGRSCSSARSEVQPEDLQAPLLIPSILRRSGRNGRG